MSANTAGSSHSTARHLRVIACHVCGLVCDDSHPQCTPLRCQRCGAAMHRRQPNSIARSWALLLAAVVFYIPANVLPVMYRHTMGIGGSESTVIGGVIEFWEMQSYGIALVIFVASVVVPCTKFIVLGLLLVTAQRRSTWAMQERARLYRLVEVIGYWSMLDVMVVAVIAALVKFQALSFVEPRIGILFFGAVVILTMLSSMQFDPRLIWDGQDNE